MPPRYRSRSCYRTRRSASERVALDPRRDFGATALDRPRIELPVRAPPRARRELVRPWLDRPGILGRVLAITVLGCGACGTLAGCVMALWR